MNSERQSNIVDECTKSLCSLISISKFSSLPSTDNAIPPSQTVLIPESAGNDPEMAVNNSPASEDQNLMMTSASSSINDTAPKDDAVELLVNKVDVTEDKAYHDALGDEVTRIEPQMNSVEVESATAVDGVGNKDMSSSPGVNETLTSVTGGEDTVRRKVKKSHKRKTHEQCSPSGQEMSDLNYCLESEKHRSVTDMYKIIQFSRQLRPVQYLTTV